MNICLVGASGTAGRSILADLGGDLSILALSRTPSPDALPANVRWKSADIQNRDALRAALKDEAIDTLVYAAAGQPIVAKYNPISVAALRRLAQRVERKPSHSFSEFFKTSLITQTYDPGHRNFAMFNSVVQVLQERKRPIKHIVLISGGMSYGIHTGPVFNSEWTGQLAEDSPRHEGPNWYYDMEDYAALLRANYCPVTVLRPSYILYEGGFVRQNLAHSIGLYLESQRQLGAPAIFPGGEENYDCSWSFTPSSLIGRQVDWVVHDQDQWGECFNAVGQTPIKWSVLWPQLAKAYGLTVEVPRLALSLGRHVRANLTDYPLLAAHEYNLDYFSPIDFIDIAMVNYWDMVYSMDKAISRGFDADADVMHPFAFEQQRLEEWQRERAQTLMVGESRRPHQ